jgi:DNA-binding response OmpR family regulator
MQPEVESHSPNSPADERVKIIILSIGNDEALLSYRSKVLNLAGFEVVSAQPQPAAANQFSCLYRVHAPALAIACHTLTSVQRLAMARQLREACPQIPLLALTNGALSDAEIQSFDLLLDSLDGPAELIRQVRSRL